MYLTALFDSINKLRECFDATTAALAPYPVGAISKKRKCNVAKHKSNSNTVECDEQNGHD